MGVFDSHADSPESIRIEGEQVTIRFSRTGPTTGRVSWNIPPPANGCTSETSAYCGMLVTLDTQPATINTAPTNGTIYTADPTGDSDLHAGDKIDSSLIIGAFYEGEKKGTGESLTTFFDITGLDSNTPYYIAGYAVDCVFRYHTQGVFTYSQNLGSEGTSDTSGYQEVDLGRSGTAKETDGTGLKLGQDYKLKLLIDGTSYTLSINGSDAQTYSDLVEAINNELEKLTTAPQSPFPPNQNAYFYDKTTSKLYQWDGSQHNELDVLNESTDPTALAVDDTWYDTENEVLYRWNGSTWILASNVIKYIKDPLSLTSSDYWYHGGSPSRGYQRCGNVWCEKTLYDQTTDPASGITPDCGTYWYNPSDGLLQQWSDKSETWQGTSAIYWNMDPSSFSNGTLWFDDDNNKLYSWNSTLGLFDPVARGYQDVILDGTSIPYTDDTIALSEGTYTDDVVVNGTTVTITLVICNAIEGRFKNVFAEINKQLQEGSPIYASIDFREDSSTNLALRITSETVSSPEIQAGGNLFNSIVDWSSNGTPISGTPVIIGGDRPTPLVHTYWVDTENEVVESLGGSPTGKQCSIFFDKDPTDRESCDLWWNSDTDILNVWDVVANSWIQVSSFTQSTVDPAGSQTVTTDSLWYNPSTDTLSQWDGSQWNEVNFINYPTDPAKPTDGDYFWNTTTDQWSVYSGSPLVWTSIDPIESSVNPSAATITTGTFWYDTMNDLLFIWNGTNWISILFGTQPLTPTTGDYWYNTSTNTLMMWNGTSWVEGTPIALAEFINGNLRITSSTEGSDSKISLYNTAGQIPQVLRDYVSILTAVCGTDGLKGIPTTQQLGIGTDGSSDERRKMASDIRRQLGYPNIEVELDKEQINILIDRALEELRRRASPYHRGFMILPITYNQQRYQLSNKGMKDRGYKEPDGSYTGYDSIVQVMGVYRVTSAFMTSAHGSGVFGQVVLQHLYNMGTFDLLSFYLVSEYIEQLEHLFASRLTFNWNERTRVLWLHQVFSQNERAIMDVVVESTEQELLTDRFTKRWIERWALALCRLTLSETRGKFATYPGAGGGISLNAADLKTTANEEFEALIAEVDNYQVSRVEELGQNCEFIIG